MLTSYDIITTYIMCVASFYCGCHDVVIMVIVFRSYDSVEHIVPCDWAEPDLAP